MKIIRDLAVTRDELFDYLEESFCAELAKATGSPAERSMLKTGFTYSAAGGATSVEVVRYDRGCAYESLTRSGRDCSRSSYLVEPSEREGRIKVTFRQEIDSFDRRKSGPMKLFSEAIYLGRMADSLFTMQDKIVAAREDSAAGGTEG